MAAGLAMLIENVWEMAAEYDCERRHPDEPSVVALIREHWKREADAGDLVCLCCGSTAAGPGLCERCGLLLR